MSQPVSHSPLKIFISYRRDDSAGYALHLFDSLSAHFGRDQIFMDIEQIEPGADFVQVIEDAVGSCDVLVALIGRHWLTVADGTSRRLDDPNDFVRLEIVSALNRDVRVIPVLVQGATMPRPQDLPGDLVSLSRRNAFDLSDRRWGHDVNRLITALEKIGRRESEHGAGYPKKFKIVLMIACAVLLTLIGITLFIRLAREPMRRETAPPVSQTPLASQVEDGAQRIELVWIPAGSFRMGSEDGHGDEKPVQRLTISQGFYMGRYEVTQAQWQAVMGNNPSNFKGDNLPVEEVSWNDAQEFIGRLNRRDDGYTYRLPSEAEWEYAARAGTTGDYAGDLDAMAWYGNNSGRTRLAAAEIFRTDPQNYYRRITDNGGQTHPVGSKRPNAFGLFDMHGNVWEWCQDWYHESYVGAPLDGGPWLGGGRQKERVLRGGSWYFPADFCRSSNRNRNAPDTRYDSNGIRVVATPRQ